MKLFKTRSALLDNAYANPKLKEYLRGHPDGVNTIAFSPDATILASGSNGDGRIIFWDVETGNLIGPSLGMFAKKVAFSPDGQTLVSGSQDGTIILWNLSPQYWIELSCQRVGRNFMRAEWLYFPNEIYRKTCEQWPLEQEVIATP